MLDYQNWSVMYDKTRQCNTIILAKIMEYITPEENIKILDFGCGTGNYLEAVSQLSHAQCYGVDASSEMLDKARNKKIIAELYRGSHKRLPFPDNFFDFIYVLDVFQHIPQGELHLLFAELSRVLKTDCPILFLTVSHKQLNKRTWNYYFPSAATIQISRFPDISQICDLGEFQNLSYESMLTLEEIHRETIPELFINHVCNKAYSVFHLLDEQEYQNGKKQLLKDYEAKKEWEYNHGETIIVFRKNQE